MCSIIRAARGILSKFPRGYTEVFVQLYRSLRAIISKFSCAIIEVLRKLYLRYKRACCHTITAVLTFQILDEADSAVPLPSDSFYGLQGVAFRSK